MVLKHEDGRKQADVRSTRQSRRAALKKLAFGTSTAAAVATLPGKWIKPLVNKVLVPAHAQTSTDPPVTTSDPPVTTSNPPVTTSNPPVTTNYSGNVTLVDSTAGNISRYFCVSITGDVAVVYYNLSSSGTGTVSGGVTVTSGLWTYQVLFSNLSQNTVTITVTGSWGNNTRTGQADLNSTVQACS